LPKVQADFIKASKTKKKSCMNCRETNHINAQVSFTETTLARVLHNCSYLFNWSLWATSNLQSGGKI